MTDSRMMRGNENRGQKGLTIQAKCGKTHLNTKMSGRTGQSLRGYGYIAKGSRVS